MGGEGGGERGNGGAARRGPAYSARVSQTADSPSRWVDQWVSSDGRGQSARGIPRAGPPKTGYPAHANDAGRVGRAIPPPPSLLLPPTPHLTMAPKAKADKKPAAAKTTKVAAKKGGKKRAKVRSQNGPAAPGAR